MFENENFLYSFMYSGFAFVVELFVRREDLNIIFFPFYSKRIVPTLIWYSEKIYTCVMDTRACELVAGPVLRGSYEGFENTYKLSEWW